MIYFHFVNLLFTVNKLIAKGLDIEKLSVQEKILLNNQKLYFLRENMSLGIKEEMEGYIHLSKNASKLLSLYEYSVFIPFLSHVLKSK